MAAIKTIIHFTFSVGVAHRPPHDKIQDNLKLIETIKTASTDNTAVKFGDFNYPGVDWSALLYHPRPLGKRTFFNSL